MGVGCIAPTIKLRANCDDLTIFINGVVGFLSGGAFMAEEIDVQHQVNGRSDDGPDIIAGKELRRWVCRLSRGGGGG